MPYCRTCNDRKHVPTADGGTMFCPDCVGQAPPASAGRASSSPGCGCFGWLLGNIFLAVAFVALWGVVLAGVAIYRNVTAPKGVLGSGASTTTWSGRYTCADQDRAMRIELDVGEGVGDRVAAATLVYLDGPDGESAEASRQPVRGTLRDRELSLIAERPPATPFEVTGLNATITEEADGMLGNVTSDACQSFGVELVD